MFSPNGLFVMLRHMVTRTVYPSVPGSVVNICVFILLPLLVLSVAAA